MGTNYYFVKNPCRLCGHGEKEHIGKASYGWTFTFHGTETIKSYKDWLEEFKNKGYIINEYGEKVTLKLFKSIVKSKKKDKYNHVIEEKKNPSWRQDGWLDSEGNGFSPGEFS